MPVDTPPSQAEEDPFPSGSDFFIRHRRRPRYGQAIRARLEARRRSLTLVVVLLGAAISTPLAYVRCTGELGLDLFYTWPLVLALCMPAMMLWRELQGAERMQLARSRARARSGARRTAGRRSRRATHLNAGRRGTADRPA